MVLGLEFSCGGLKLLTYSIVSVILLILAFDIYFNTCRLMVVSTVSMLASVWHILLLDVFGSLYIVLSALFCVVYSAFLVFSVVIV